MAITTEPCPSVLVRIEHLGLSEPNGLSFLPINLETVQSPSELRVSRETATVRKIMSSGGIAVGTLIPPDVKPKLVDNNSLEWIVPTLFVTDLALSQSPTLVTIAINIISSYLFEIFRTLGRTPKIKLQIVYEKTKSASCRKISYEGDVKGLHELKDAFDKVFNEND